jgi:hypothetical protein
VIAFGEGDLFTHVPGVVGISYGAHVHERRCDRRPIETVPALRVGDRGRPADLEVVVAGKAVLQQYLRCPQCARMARVLYDPDGDENWRCQRCAKLDYSSRHELRDPLAMAVELRRKIGADLALLSPLPARPTERHAARRYDLLTAELAVAENKALRKLRSMNRGLAKYADLRGL